MSQEIPLTRGHVALVDDADFEQLSAFSWHALGDRNGLVYARRSWRAGSHQRHMLMHVAILGTTGCDHANGDTLDNRRANLRLATHAQNCANRQLFSNNTSGYKGVSFNRSHGRWQAYVRVDRRIRHLGYFDSPETAAYAHDQAARRHYGDFATLNFPRPGERPVLRSPERTAA